MLEAVGPHVASSRGLISDVCGGAQYRDKVYFETVEAKVVALDAKTGKVIWENQVADNADGYYFNHAPMIVKGKIVMGTSARGSVNQQAHGGSAMLRRTTTFGWAGLFGLCVGLLLSNLGAAQAPPPEPPPKGPTYMPVVEVDFAAVRARDVAAKPEVMQRQRTLLSERYDLSDRPAAGMMMSGGRRAVQQGVRVKLPAGLTWERLAGMTPDEIRGQALFPQGLLPLPHVKHETGGMVFPDFEITEVDKQEGRSLQRFDVDFDLPDHLLPEFPPPSS